MFGRNSLFYLILPVALLLGIGVSTPFFWKYLNDFGKFLSLAAIATLMWFSFESLKPVRLLHRFESKRIDKIRETSGEFGVKRDRIKWLFVHAVMIGTFFLINLLNISEHIPENWKETDFLANLFAAMILGLPGLFASFCLYLHICAGKEEAR